MSKINLQDYEQEEIPKGRIHISKHKSISKVKHKHQYYPVLIEESRYYAWNNKSFIWYDTGIKCSICGKAKRDYKMFNELTNTTFPLLGFEKDDFLEIYKNLEIVKENKNE